METPLALYRRYRPETFQQVIGQEHVTEPLRVALANNRVNHAYLFSGPRGCGKTTSARILARALNCDLAPVADPCGACPSCVDLARGGPGSIDVIEIDAASHGGVDDARDLREKAFFAPVRSRYKVYIIDEAHMVTTQGFNALLKLVEEPPPHLRFIFATTEPEKVIATIRSRTHHYPFRLIPPRLLSSYLTELCEQEGVSIEPAALPLVVRAGAGSARDTLSVLDQLLGGAGAEGVTYALASGLLGYTPDTLLDEVVDSFAAGDGSAVFGVVDKVIETGQDPRRFTEDLLRRLRDLVIVSAVPDAPATGLIDVSEDQGERLVAQAARFGAAELTRAADLVATGLTEMRGATAPRLLLELICARVLLPGADHSTDGVLARLDRLERRAAISGGAPVPDALPAPTPGQDRPAQVRPAPHEPEPLVAAPVAPVVESEVVTPPPPPPAPVAPEPEPEPEPEPVPAPAVVGSSTLSLVDVRRLWPDIVEATKQRRRVTWIHLTQHAQVVAVDATTLTLGFSNAGARDSFDNGGSSEIVRQSAIDVVGADWQVETIVDPGASADVPPPPAAGPPQPEPVRPDLPVAVDERPVPEAPPAWASDEPAAAEPGAPESRPGPESVRSAREAIQTTRPAGEDAARGADLAAADADAHPDDLDADSEELGGAELLARELGAQIIEEIRHS
ncbi:hypothetical protein NPS01_29550 [Nocardioides psychrotolerans]|uniref:DNA polymerase III subunit gamma/tau n=1 Tax=Nocardioides psychrotolerans TaxID=1005945 RepID=A0A1I3DYD2_9ACTN|nr:DNA polymerase III subunit gamma and tau [Nocardioides psychrotolerans]GEP39292.1 hypothetical protein NPS01_29550 [Nocardioides psychrotolerans]SFH91740.1 DNA polymerase-3 subunit gamma/tau [Nocardioides psychrotolerans]